MGRHYKLPIDQILEAVLNADTISRATRELGYVKTESVYKALRKHGYKIKRTLSIEPVPRRCKNMNCKRYFVPAKKGQEYCSDPCAYKARMEQKRRWWNAHGKQRRQLARLRRKQNGR